MAPDSLARVVGELPAAWHGQFFATLDSTQDVAKAAARAAAPDRSIVVADFQRLGRGRHGRTWSAAPGSALLLSILFREAAAQSTTPWRFTCLASVALLQAIEGCAPHAPVAIKWPNDVMLADRKVAGILAETSWDGRELVAIVGVGVNVNAEPEEVPGATSLSRAAGALVDRGALLSTFLRSLDELRTLPVEELHRRWEARLWRRGQTLRLLDTDRQAEEVVVLGAASDGSLRVRGSDGVERRTSTGELLG